MFCRGFSAIDNLYIIFYMSDVSENCDSGEHMGVLYYIQLCSVNLDGTCLEWVALVYT